MLYIRAAADPAKALAIAAASLDRLGVCNGSTSVSWTTPQLTSPNPSSGCPCARPRRSRCRRWRLARRRRRSRNGPLTPRDGNVTAVFVDDLDEAVRLANEETSGLAAGIVTEDEGAAARFLDGYRGTAAFWHAPTRFTDGFEADRVAGDRDQRRLDSGAAQSRHCSPPLAAPVPSRRRRDRTAVKRLVVKLGSSLVAGPQGRIRRSVLSSRAREIAALVRPVRQYASSRQGPSHSASRGSASTAAQTASRASRRRPPSGRRGSRPPGTGRSHGRVARCRPGAPDGVGRRRPCGVCQRAAYAADPVRAWALFRWLTRTTRPRPTRSRSVTMTPSLHRWRSSSGRGCSCC